MALKNKTAIITGSSKGIGAAIAIELARQGCNTVINYNSDVDGAREVLRKIKNIAGADSIMVKADIGKYRDVKKLFREAADSFKKIDVLVNNAGIAIWKPFLEITEVMWDRTIDTNLKGAFMCSQAAAKMMIETGGGTIVNISSLGANGSMDCLVPYVTSKGGMTLLTKALAVELAPYNIRVNTIAPGTIDIERNRKTDPDYPDDWIPYIPMGRVGKVKDITGPVVFLCSEESSYITGQNIYVCGGQTDYVPMPRSGFAR